MTNEDYKVPNFPYKPRKVKNYKSHVRGHIIDHRDTIQVGQSEWWSTYDKRNYIPEPPSYHWGLGTRRSAVSKIRKSVEGVAYAQLMEYPEPVLKTSNGTSVPNAIYYYCYNSSNNNYKLNEVFSVEWCEDLSRPNKSIKYLDHAKNNFTTSLDAAPVVLPYSPDQSDRALRLAKRNSAKLSTEIRKKRVKSRFPEKSTLYALGDAADIEVTGVDQRMKVGFFADENGDQKLSLEYVKRAFTFD